MFDHTIKPVLLYGSEIWSIFSAEKLNKLRDSYFNKLCSDLIAEILHVKFCKYVLEISRRSTNIAIAGELGRYPLFLEVILNMIKYFIHLSNPICTALVAEFFEASRKLHLENKRSWYRNITEVIDYFGMDKCKIFNLKSTLKKIIFQCLCMKYKNTWKSELFNDKRHNSCGNKLRTYRLFKDQFVYEPYLNWGTYNQRNILTKFRISSHKLEIQKGRYMNIPAEQRICRLCKLHCRCGK